MLGGKSRTSAGTPVAQFSNRYSSKSSENTVFPELETKIFMHFKVILTIT